MTAEQALSIVFELTARAHKADEKRQLHFHRQIRSLCCDYNDLDAEKIDEGIYDFTLLS